MSLETDRKKQRSFEVSQGKLLAQFLEKQSENWQFIEISEQIAFDKNNEDLILLGEKMLEFSEKAKEENKRMFIELYLKVIRISSYCMHLETVAKHAANLYRNESKKIALLESEKRLLSLEKTQKENEIKSLKKEIEFLTNE